MYAPFCLLTSTTYWISKSPAFHPTYTFPIMLLSYLVEAKGTFSLKLISWKFMIGHEKEAIITIFTKTPTEDKT
jgi:hypothetical protein